MHTELYIGGAWHKGHGERFASYDPATGDKVWEGHAANEDDVAEAMAAARLAFPAWSRRPVDERIAIVRSGNFSLGVNLLAALVEQAAQRLGPDWDIEITEAHHRRKADAPSGTALLLGDAAAHGRNVRLESARLKPHDGITGARKEGGIGFSAIRGGGIVGEHDVRFIAEREILTLSHTALDRAVFADGALAAALWVADKPPGLYSMRDVLGL